MSLYLEGCDILGADPVAVTPVNSISTGSRRRMLVVGGVAVGVMVFGLAGTVYLIVKSKWALAVLNFFVLTPVAMAVAGGITTLVVMPKKIA